MSDPTKGMADIFVLDAELPDQVFQDDDTLGFLFTDNAVLTSPDLWSVVAGLSRRHGARSVFAQVVRPSSVGGTRMPLFESAPGESAGRWRGWLDYSAQEEGEPLYILASTVAIWSDSPVWGLWIDRSIELAVLGVPLKALGETRDWLDTIVEWPWFDPGDTDNLLAPAYHPTLPPPDILRTLRVTFGSAKG